VTASALIVHPPTGRVLLRWHARQRAWIQVGGNADPGETDPLAVALREGAEETGLRDLTPWPGPGLVQVAVVPVPAAPHEPAHEHADLRFLLATGTPEAAVPEKPDAPLRWLPVEEAHALTTEPNVRELLSRTARFLDGPSPPG
jgi:8-oxo-dGTP pyrophosphatase MutT (NUDIX family)